MPKRPQPALLALTAALVCAIVLAAILASSHGGGAAPSTAGSPSSTSGIQTASQSGFQGAALPRDTIARDFTLTDQRGRSVSLSDYRGRVVVLAFLYSTCDSTCVVIAEQIRGALDELSDEHTLPPAVLIVSANPAADTRARVAGFLSRTSLNGRVEYLTGSQAQLRAVWRAYGVIPASAGGKAFDQSATVLALDTSGHPRVAFQEEQLTPESLSHDIRKLDGDPIHP
jgi:protein SCO1